MSDKVKDKLKQLPNKPGVYFHKSKTGEIIYVGKAAILKNRVRQYFQNSRSKDSKTMALVEEIYDIDWIITDSELDALFLESEMVKRYMPKFNVLLRDDKSQCFIRINMKDEWPTVTMTRNPADDGAEYYGPFFNSYAIRKALRYLRRVFPYLPKERKMMQSKLDEDLGLSPKKSDGSENYKVNLRKLISYIKGNRKQITKELEKEMNNLAKEYEFEKAAKIRNKLMAMKELQRRIMFGDKEFMDISKDKALTDLMDLFGLLRIPYRIEGFDISHMSGKNVVASMVVFVNGVSSRSDYRKFKVSEKNDDYANMYETIYRRFGERNMKSWGKPDLVFIDGGKPQLSAAIKALKDRNVKISVVGIAKRDEEIVVSKSGSNVILDKVLSYKNEKDPTVRVYEDDNFVFLNLHVNQMNAGSHSKNMMSRKQRNTYEDIIMLYQRIRDESHRFAVQYHSVLRQNKSKKSALDEIPGIGPITKKKLLRKFKSIKSITSDKNELIKVVGEKKAEEIFKHLEIDNDKK